MPYKTNEELPAAVSSKLPKHAQDIFRETYNSAYDRYKDPDKRRGKSDREEASFKTAWSAVKQKYAKGEDDKWHAK